jgi:predicted 2-oxoglutarate/Fe(II)-dependent dioxygenase YbiX
MKIIYNDNPFFHIYLENVFSTEELKIIFKEINELKKHFKDSEFTGSASFNFEILKKNTGMFLAEYKDYENLKTIKIIDKCIKKISTNNNWKNLAFKRLFNSLMWGGELANCYKKNDYYKPHADYGIFSLIFFLWENTSNFEGGDLFFPEYDYLHKCNSNCGILFFSKELHGVTPIIVNEEKSTRYSIVTFSTIKEENLTLKKRNIINSNSILYQ